MFHEDEVAIKLYDMDRLIERNIAKYTEHVNVWSRFRNVAFGISGGMFGPAGNVVELADYYLTATSETEDIHSHIIAVRPI